MLLAVGCGLAILAAGVAFFLQLASEDEPEFFAAGDTASVGDLMMSVTAYDESATAAVVTLRVSGVDDPDGIDSFRLVVPEHRLSPSGDAPERCAELTVAEQTCTLTFALDDVAGGSRILHVERGDEEARWELHASSAEQST